MTYGFAGMTHLGLVFATMFAKQGYDVKCYDLHGVVNLVKIAPGEPGLVDAWNAGVEAGRLSLADGIGNLVDCDCIYISQDVMDHAEDQQSIRDLVQLVSTIRRPDTIVVVLSQVPPGFTRSITSIPHTHLFNMLDPLIFGESMKRANDPPVLAIGMERTDLADARVIRLLCDPWEGTPRSFNLYEEVEFAKIAINCYLAAQITMTNVLAEVGASVGIHWDAVRHLVSQDDRIGDYLTPGLGIGGGHLLRDVATARTTQRRFNHDSAFLEGLFTTDAYFKFGLLDRILLGLDVTPENTIALLGLTYKFGTTSANSSPALALISSSAFRNIRGHDPLILAFRAEEFKGMSVEYLKDFQKDTELDTVAGAKVVIVTTPYPQYSDLTLSSMVEVMAPDPIMIDPYGSFNRVAAEVAGFKYITLGE